MPQFIRWSPAFLVVAALGCGSSEQSTTVTVTRTETVTVQASAATPSPPVPSASSDPAFGDIRIGQEQTYENVGEIEIDGEPVSSTLKVRVSVLQSNIPNPRYLKPQDGNKYVRIDVRLTNVGKDAFTPSADFQAVTKEGDSSNFQSLGRPGDLGPAAIRPGGSARGRVWAEIPKGSTIQDVVFAPYGGDAKRDLVWSRK